MSAQQLPLFPLAEMPPSAPAKPATRFASSSAHLTARSPLSAAVESFRPAMILKGFTQNTIDSFLDDLTLVVRWLGANRPVGDVGTQHLKDFLEYLLHGRGKPCTPKSYARRLTTLKVFFGWLADTQVIAGDPAATIAHQPVSSPLPQILFDEEVDRLIEAGQALRSATAQGPGSKEKPDARPLFLFRLLLATGIKKAECMALQLSDIDTSDPDAPAILIRYDNPRQRHKERKLAAGAAFTPLLREYRAQYHPQIHLFECTHRNLEYVLRDLGVSAGVKTAVSFETLRMTCAVRDFRRGVPPEALRVKLGLSQISWEGTAPKIERLAAPAI
jgi:site-specific recombinase XerD